MQRLITFGCSFTQGQYLETDDPGSNCYSRLAWPFQLADKLKLECHNQGVNGSSAKKIWHKIVNFNFKKDDLVIILWTHKDRWCILKDDKNTIDFFPSYIEKRELTRTFYSQFYDEYDITETYSLFVDHANRFIKGKGLKVYNLDSNLSPMALKYTDIEFLKTDINEIRRRHPKALDNSHPGKEAHLEFANQVYNEIKDDIQENYQGRIC